MRLAVHVRVAGLAAVGVRYRVEPMAGFDCPIRLTTPVVDAEGAWSFKASLEAEFR